MYLFIAYKPNSDDCCRGCHMASYKSDFVSENGLTAEDLLERWSKYLIANKNLRCGETGYDFYIYEDGFQLYQGDYFNGFGYYDDDLDCEEIDKLEADFNKRSQRLNEIFEKAESKAEETYQTQLEAQIAKVNANKAMNEAKEREQYEILKKKFERNNQ